MDGVRPSSSTAPSIWYDDVATPHRNVAGRLSIGSGEPPAADSVSRAVVVVFMSLQGVLRLVGGQSRGRASETRIARDSTGRSRVRSGPGAVRSRDAASRRRSGRGDRSRPAARAAGSGRRRGRTASGSAGGTSTRPAWPRRSGGEPGMPVSSRCGAAQRREGAQQSLAVRVQGVPVELGRRRLLDDAPAVHDRDPVGELHQQRQVVGDEDDREAELARAARPAGRGSAAARPRRARSSARP